MPERLAGLNRVAGTMLILAFDTALQATRVAVWNDGKVLARADELSSRGQAERLMPMIESVMAEAKIDFAALDRIAATCGPGSFTGVRIGIAAARGLALAIGRVAIGVSTTAALAGAVSDDERQESDVVVAAIDSQRGDLFAQMFERGDGGLSPVVNVTREKLAAMIGDRKVVVVGDGTEAVVAVLSSAVRSRASSLCDPALVASIAATRPAEPAGPVPIYARAPDVTVGAGNRALRT